MVDSTKVLYLKNLFLRKLQRHKGRMPNIWSGHMTFVQLMPTLTVTIIDRITIIAVM